MLNSHLFVILVVLMFCSVKNTAQNINVIDIKKVNDPSNLEKLTEFFKDYETFSFDVATFVNQSANRSVSDIVDLNIDRDFSWQFTLEPVQILTPETQFYSLTESGRQAHRKPITTKTYKGKFADGREGHIRLTVNDHFFYGVIEEEGTKYYIEPLRYYNTESRSDQFVIYNAADVQSKHSNYHCDKTCEDVHPESINESGERLVGMCYKAKLAILADYSMYLNPSHAGIDAVINHVVGVVNNAQIHYEYNGSVNFDDGINFEISEVVVSTCPTCDPISSQLNPNLLLAEFSTWVDQGGFYHPFHAAHFWSARDFIGSTVGMAFQSSNLYCQSKARAVLEDFSNTASFLEVMLAHEIGHNFNGVHDGSNGFILSPVVSVTSTWSPLSKTTIGTQITNQGTSCLDACSPPVCDRVEDISLSNINESGFTIAWTHTTNHLYTVKVKEKGSNSFIEDLTTINNSLTISPPGYAICKEYDVYVYNNCGSSGFSAVQRLIMKAPIDQGCADFKSNMSVGWNGSTVTFTDNSLNASSWFWDFGNGQTSTIQSPTVTFPTNGMYDVSLTVNNIHTMTKDAFVMILPEKNLPYTQAQGGNFESNSDDFAATVLSGTVNVWEKGVANVGLNNGSTVWKSILNGNIPQVTSKSALYTPKFNLSGYQNYTVNFTLGLANQFCNGPIGTQMEYSTDNGVTWILLGSAPSFYNAGPNEFCPLATQVFANKTGWTAPTSSPMYINKSIDISFLSGQSNVVFRFVVSISGIFSAGYDSDGIMIDNFYIDAVNAVPLAIKEESLVVEKKENTAILSWDDDQSQNIQQYIIYKSADGLEFEQIGEISQDIAFRDHFNFVDKTPLTGFNYYQVASIDHNGEKVMSNIVSIKFAPGNEINIYPNPVLNDGKLFVKWNGEYPPLGKGIIYNTVGNKVMVVNINRTGENVDVSQLKTGIYFLKLFDHFGNEKVAKIVKL